MELLSPLHLLIIFLVALLLFGPKKLPELGKGIGEGFRALKEGMKDKPAADEQASADPVATRQSSCATLSCTLRAEFARTVASDGHRSRRGS